MLKTYTTEVFDLESLGVYEEKGAVDEDGKERIRTSEGFISSPKIEIPEMLMEKAKVPLRKMMEINRGD